MTNPDIPMHYRIRLAVELAGNQYEALAKELDVHVNTVHNYIAGRSKPRRPAIKTIAEFCRVSPQWIETGEVSVTNPLSLRYGDQLDMFDLLTSHVTTESQYADAA